MPALNYVSNDSQNVSVTYSDMPAGTGVVLVNQVSGAKKPLPPLLRAPLCNGFFAPETWLTNTTPVPAGISE